MSENNKQQGRGNHSRGSSRSRGRGNKGIGRGSHQESDALKETVNIQGRGGRGAVRGSIAAGGSHGRGTGRGNCGTEKKKQQSFTRGSGQRGRRLSRGSRTSAVHQFPPMNEDVVSYCKKYHIMYIMRGLPGSGKSTVAQNIQQKFPSGVVKICSADDFRINSCGEYVWDPKKMKETHGQCERLAYQLCKDKGTHVVIIDNTNMQQFEYQNYLSIAHQFGYPVVFVTLNQQNTKLLASKTTHNVPETKIKQMRSNFQVLQVPYFYSWLVPQKESIRLRDIIANMVKKCEDIIAFKHELSQTYKTCAKNIFSTYDLRLASSKDSHVTAAFTDEGRIPGSINYNKSKKVNESLGTVSKLTIIGWCITPKSVFARIKLSEEQTQLWGRDDSIYEGKNQLCFEPMHVMKRTIDKLFQDLCIEKTQPIEDHYFNLPKAYKNPNHRVGCTAHITLGVHTGLRPIVAKDDIVQLVHLEVYTTPKEEYPMGNMLLRSYQKDMWVVYLKQPIVLPAIFCGHYKYAT